MKIVTLVLSTMLATVFGASTILIHSTAATAIFPGSNAVIPSSPGPTISGIDPQAVMIWVTPCSNSGGIYQSFSIPCGSDLMMYFHATPDVQFQINSTWYSGDQAMVLTQSNFSGSCGQTTYISITVKSSACVAGVTGLAYTLVATPTPPPTACSPGCLTCTPDFLTCITCLQHAYRIAAPDSNGKCPCLPSFYMDPTTSLCVACPLNLYCKTCAYNTSASAVKCLNCNCAQHRVFNSTTSTCECDALHHQDGLNAYCALT